jgi:pilus assembly protein Flp/PilA
MLLLTYLRIRVDAHLARMDQRGATAVEYGLIVAGVALVCIPAIAIFFHAIKAVFEAESSKIGTPSNN